MMNMYSDPQFTTQGQAPVPPPQTAEASGDSAAGSLISGLVSQVGSAAIKALMSRNKKAISTTAGPMPGGNSDVPPQLLNLQ